uniref:COR domain-containing protein n=1 Tax=Candidatus Electronema sp. TaxID=2698783 RepID=UPI004056CF88
MTNEELIELIVEAKASGAQSLNLRKKGIASLPPELFSLTDLIALDLSCNQLKVLPPEIARLTKLEQLNLCNNPFAALPPELFQLGNLTALGLSELRLTAVPPEICQLKKLTVLYLHQNQLATLPPEISQLKNLRELILWGNQLAALPPEICQLDELTVLDVSGNPIISPPPEIVRKGIEAMRLHFAFRQSATQPLNEVKVILIGDSAAGKTSLLKQLFGGQFDEQEAATRGIGIQVWKTEAAGRQIKVNLWDFGGHETMHASHQFFLSKRSLYILVLDRASEERTEYWLQHIKTFGGNSPVLIVLNKQDVNPGFDVNRSSLREKHHCIREFFHTSCKTGVGVATFKEMLLAELAKAETTSIRWTEPWFAVKLRIMQMRRPWIGCKKYLSICGEERINNEKTCKMLVEFLHDLGAVVHFKGFALDDMHVLDTAWATSAVYMIITAPELAASRGVLHAASFFKILWQNDVGACSCPQETHPYIMSLMRKLDLCYELDKESVLVPQLLPVSEPHFAFEQRGSLRFILCYPDFLPPSVFPRFIVKAHEDIKNQTCWRTGVLLEDRRSGSLALIKEDAKARQINVWVHGERRREYLHYLRYLLAAINSGFENLKVMERLPVPDARNITADYGALLAYTKNGMDKYIPAGSATVYSVHELLGLVQPSGKDELLNMLLKIDKRLDDKSSMAEAIKTMFELNPNTAGIGLNMNELFVRILAWAKQRQQQTRR